MTLNQSLSSLVVVGALAACSPFSGDDTGATAARVSDGKAPADATKAPAPATGTKNPSGAESGADQGTADTTQGTGDTTPADIGHGVPGVCSLDLYPATSTGKVAGTTKGYPGFAPVDAYAFETSGGGEDGPSYKREDRDLIIVFTQTRNECEFYMRETTPRDRNILRVSLRTESGNEFGMANPPGAPFIGVGKHDNVGQFLNDGSAVDPNNPIPYVIFEREAGDSTLAIANGTVTRPGLVQSPGTFAKGSVTITERTSTLVSGSIDAVDSDGRAVKLQFSAPICPRYDDWNYKVCAPGQSG